MDSSSEEDQTQGQRPTFDRGIDPAIPAISPALTVTFQEWSRLKDHVKDIKSRENLWLSAASAFLSAGIAFLVGVISLEQVNNVGIGLLIFFYSVTVSGFLGAILCLFGYFESKGNRQKGINTAIQYMDDIESIYDRSARDS